MKKIHNDGTGIILKNQKLTYFHVFLEAKQKKQQQLYKK